MYYGRLSTLKIESCWFSNTMYYGKYTPENRHKSRIQISCRNFAHQKETTQHWFCRNFCRLLEASIRFLQCNWDELWSSMSPRIFHQHWKKNQNCHLLLIRIRDLLVEKNDIRKPNMLRGHIQHFHSTIIRRIPFHLVIHPFLFQPNVSRHHLIFEVDIDQLRQFQA